MKTGLLTFYHIHHYGAMLQAYATERAVASLGSECEIIDYYVNQDNTLFQRPTGLGSAAHDAHTALHYGPLKARYERFEAFSRENLNISGRRYQSLEELRQAELPYDVLLSGSDQIWNLDCTNGIVNPFFLSFAGDRRRVAYAPSLAHTSFKPENFDKRSVSALLSKFDYISVREEETVPLFQPLVDKPIDVVLDPTLLLNASDYAEMISKMVLEGEYIFMYLLRECPELIESTVSMASATGRKVAYISEKNLDIPNSVNLFGVGPEEFVSLIAHAGLILTNSFHATVFSVLFHKPFRVFATDNSGSRMRDLLSNIGLSDRCVDVMCADNIVPCDWDDVDSRLDSLREHSWAFLRKALS